MNCQDIGRILDSGKFSALSASERRDGEAHAHSCRHCAPRWAVHARLAEMPIPAMPPELASRCQTLMARPRGNVLRFAPRTLIVVSGFVVLAAAAAMVTAKYLAPAPQHEEVPAPQPETVATVPPPLVVPEPQPDKPVQKNAEGEPDMNKPASIAATIAAASVAAAAQAQTAPPTGAPIRITAEQLVTSNDLNKDGIVTREEAKEANKALIVMWDMYDTDRDGRLDVAEIRKASQDVSVGNATQKITGDSGSHKSMPDPAAIIKSNDQDGDGIVTKEEATKAAKSLIGLWNVYDLNKDGKVDVTEVAKASGY